MRMWQGVRTGLGQGASPVSYRHNFLVFFYEMGKMLSGELSGQKTGLVV